MDFKTDSSRSFKAGTVNQSKPAVIFLTRKELTSFVQYVSERGAGQTCDP